MAKKGIRRGSPRDIERAGKVYWDRAGKGIISTGSEDYPYRKRRPRGRPRRGF